MQIKKAPTKDLISPEWNPRQITEEELEKSMTIEELAGYLMEKGEKAKSGKYRKFYQDMQRARAKFIQKNMKDIQENKSWMAKQYLLQVTDPEQFVVAEKQEMEANINADANLNADVDLTSDDFLNRELDLMKKIIEDKKE